MPVADGRKRLGSHKRIGRRSRFGIGAAGIAFLAIVVGAIFFFFTYLSAGALARQIAALQPYHAWTIKDVSDRAFDLPGVSDPVKAYVIYPRNANRDDPSIPMDAAISIYSWNNASDVSAYIGGFVDGPSPIVWKCNPHLGRYRVVVFPEQSSSPELINLLQTSARCGGHQAI